MYQNYIKIVYNVEIMYKITYKYYFHPIGFWIGGSDRRQECVWRWETSGSRLYYTHWEPGEHDYFDYICIYIPGDNYWLGGSDRRQEGMWRWETSGSRLNFTHWAPGQPDGGIQNCLYIYDGSWRNWHCYRNLRYICESA